MKKQISNLINGSENTHRDMNHPKYKGLKLIANKPEIGGTPLKERAAVAEIVNVENPESMKINVKGLEMILDRWESASGKTWEWTKEITAEEFAAITGEEVKWSHKGAVNRYWLSIFKDCTVYATASSSKKQLIIAMDEAFINIL